MRSELTSAQRGHYTARRAEIREALCPTPAPEAYALDSYGDEGEGNIQVEKVFPPEIGYKKPPPQTKSFAASTAELTDWLAGAVCRCWCSRWPLALLVGLQKLWVTGATPIKTTGYHKMKKNPALRVLFVL